jgi:hypothetical protein
MHAEIKVKNSIFSIHFSFSTFSHDFLQLIQRIRISIRFCVLTLILSFCPNNFFGTCTLFSYHESQTKTKRLKKNKKVFFYKRVLEFRFCNHPRPRTAKLLWPFTHLCLYGPLRAASILWQVGGGRALQIESFLGPVKWHRADRRVPFGAQTLL